MADLVFGSSSIRGALAEVSAGSDVQARFVSHFVAACVQVMNLDGFDLA